MGIFAGEKWLANFCGCGIVGGEVRGGTRGGGALVWFSKNIVERSCGDFGVAGWGLRKWRLNKVRAEELGFFSLVNAWCINAVVGIGT